MTILQGLGLGALQGLTEFLPVSSSGHLVLARELLGVGDEPAVEFAVLVHAGSLLAIVVYFWRDIVSLLTRRRRLVPWLVVGSLPAVGVYVAFREVIEGGLFESPTAVGVALLVTGTVLWLSERRAADARGLEAVTWLDAVAVGVAQAVAIVPGISRSGMTIGGGLARGIERRAAVVFAFLLGAVAIAGATGLKARRLVAMGADGGWGPMAASFGASLAVSLAALAVLTALVRRKCLFGFAIYCYAVGGAVLLAKLTGLW
ncbi:MAG: undecaprenyl-diphosphate phosphatase [Candidatus Brocadiia bacterium]